MAYPPLVAQNRIRSAVVPHVSKRVAGCQEHHIVAVQRLSQEPPIHNQLAYVPHIICGIELIKEYPQPSRILLEPLALSLDLLELGS